MFMSSFRTRQAPSPTGYLHLGTTRTLLFTKLFAVINNGIYYLRLEDTDRARLNKVAAIGLVENLSMLGLSPDEGVNLDDKGAKDSYYGVSQTGNYGPYIQSERLDIYHNYAQKLINAKLAYWSYLTVEEKQELQEVKSATKKPIDYSKVCHQKYSQDQLYKSLQDGLNDPQKPALTYKLQRDNQAVCDDLLVGQTSFNLKLEEDFVIMKSDGYPSYHLAHLVDDYLMKTSLVIRGQEWYPSMPKHITMFKDCFESGVLDRKYVEWTRTNPSYLHLPFVLKETGTTKMSKRDGNVNMQDYLDKGYLPEAIINYLAFLGWNPGSEKEVYLERSDFENLDHGDRLAKLISNISKEFSIEKLSKSPARFNIEKLNWFNREYIKLMTDAEWYDRAKTYLAQIDTTDNTIQKALLLDKNRITTLSEFGSESVCVFGWVRPSEEDIKWRKISLEESLSNLKEITNWVLSERYFKTQQNESLSTNTLNWESIIKKWLMDNNKDVGSYLWPLRVSLSGKQKSPSPFELLSILSKDEVKNRISQIIPL